MESLEPKSEAPKKLSLDAFLQSLDRAIVEKPDSIKDLMTSLDFKSEEWTKFNHSCEEHYTRNLIASKDFLYDLILLVWLPGQRAPIHDHKESSCWMRILQGELTEKRYVEVPPEEGKSDHPSQLDLIATTVSRSPEVLYIDNDRGVHSVANVGSVPSLSLHLYSPPIVDCRVWNGSECDAPSVFKSAFYSIYGMVLPQHLFKPTPSRRIGVGPLRQSKMDGCVFTARYEEAKEKAIEHRRESVCVVGRPEVGWDSPSASDASPVSPSSPEAASVSPSERDDEPSPIYKRLRTISPEPELEL